MTRKVLTTRGELAVGAVNETIALFNDVVGGDGVRHRLVVASSLPRFLALPSVISIAEEYARATLVQASEWLLEPAHPFRQSLWVHAEEKSETWSGVRDAWNDWHGVAMKDFPKHLPLLGFIEARNSIVHGLGRLTRRQLRSENKTVSNLGHAGIGVDASDSVLIEDDHVRASASVAIGLIEWLDGVVLDRALVVLY